MPRFTVQVQGKLLVNAETKEAAIERANVFMADKGLPAFKGQTYNTDPVDDSAVIPDN